MTGMRTRVSGVWKDMPKGYERVSGSWKGFTKGYVKVGGVWKQFHSASISTLMTRGSAQVGAAPLPIVTVNGYSVDLLIGSLGEPDEWDGAFIRSITTADLVLGVILQGSRPQNFFTSFTCSLGAFNSADATYTDSGTSTEWSWPVGSNFPPSGSETVTFQ